MCLSLPGQQHQMSNWLMSFRWEINHKSWQVNKVFIPTIFNNRDFPDELHDTGLVISNKNVRRIQVRISPKFLQHESCTTIHQLPTTVLRYQSCRKSFYWLPSRVFDRTQSQIQSCINRNTPYGSLFLGKLDTQFNQFCQY